MKANVDFDSVLSVLRVRFTGMFDIDEYRDFYRELVKRDDFKPGMNMIWDVSRLDLKMVNTELVREVGAVSVEFGKLRGHGKTAFVVGSDFQFGAARMFDSIHGDVIPAIFRPFKNLREAEEWILNTDDKDTED